MTVTTLDRKSALVLIDLQKGIAAMATAHPMADIIARSAALAEAFRKHGLPVVLVNVSGGAPGRTQEVRNMSGMPADWTDLVPELGAQPSDHRVTKKTWGAFTGTDLEDYLKHQGVTQIVLAGVATSIGVESTARYAYEYGFNIALATDAMTDRNPQARANSVERIFPRLGETGTADEIIARLDHRS